MKTYRSFLHWVASTQVFSMAFIHVLVAGMAWSLLTDPVEGAWGVAVWVLVSMPLVGYWAGNWWYWTERLNRGR